MGSAGDSGSSTTKDKPPEIVQVVMHAITLPAFEMWLHERGLHLYRMPFADEGSGDDEIKTYGIGIS